MYTRFIMHRQRKSAAARRGQRKVQKTFRLAPGRIRAAQRILGTATETETIEQALDLIVFRKELIDGTREMSGVRIDPAE
jgi:hypothetical protein